MRAPLFVVCLALAVTACGGPSTVAPATSPQAKSADRSARSVTYTSQKLYDPNSWDPRLGAICAPTGKLGMYAYTSNPLPAAPSPDATFGTSFTLVTQQISDPGFVADQFGIPRCDGNVAQTNDLMDLTLVVDSGTIRLVGTGASVWGSSPGHATLTVRDERSNVTETVDITYVSPPPPVGPIGANPNPVRVFPSLNPDGSPSFDSYFSAYEPNGSVSTSVGTCGAYIQLSNVGPGPSQTISLYAKYRPFVGTINCYFNLSGRSGALQVPVIVNGSRN